MKNKYLLFALAALLFGACNSAKSDIQSDIIITKESLNKVGTTVPVSAIGEPVGSVKLYEPRWVDSTESSPAYGVVEGSIFPADPNGWPINFRILLPAKWSRRSIQAGGGGINGTITVREGFNPNLNQGFAMYGSDAGHQASFSGFPGVPGMEHLAEGPSSGDEWALNEEAMKNLGYMQMKKTYDAAMVIMERIYGQKPAYKYYVGGSQGGREGLMMAQTYPDLYDGIISNIPIVNFSSLMLSPELMKIQEKSLENWVTPAKTNAIVAEFLRQCDTLDGLSDGIIYNYVDSRSIFNVNDGVGPTNPWAALRAPNGVDPNPEDNSASAKLTDGQIKTLELIYSNYKFASPLVNGVESFGMWVPTVRPGDFDMISAIRYKGQEEAGEDAPMHTSLGILGVTGFLMQDLDANPLDYVEGGIWDARRVEISKYLDATNPDLSAFYKNGGKIIFTIGTMDNIASPGAQLDYYQSLLDEMGQNTIDDFARLYVVPQAGHGMPGRSYQVNGNGEEVEAKTIPFPTQNENLNMLTNWVEKNQAPGKTLVVSEDGSIKPEKTGKGYLLCSYPNYPRYIGGPADDVSSYESTAPELYPQN